jgi:hypothetical protein
MYRSQPAMLIFLFFILLVHTNCSRHQDDRQLIESLSQKLEQSATVNFYEIMTMMKSLEEKTEDFCTRERALEWFPKAKEMEKLTTEIRNKAYALKAGILKGENAIKNLIADLHLYKNNLQQIDSSFITAGVLNNSFLNSFFTAITGDSTGKHSPKFSVDDYKMKARLNMLIAELNYQAYKLINYCISKVVCNKFINTWYEPILSQNTEVLEPGKTLKIKAGIGSYSKQVLSEVIFGDRKTPLNDYGYAEYNVKAPSKPGMYSVPVHISFLNPFTGKKEEQTSNIQYRVVAPCTETP